MKTACACALVLAACATNPVLKEPAAVVVPKLDSQSSSFEPPPSPGATTEEVARDHYEWLLVEAIKFSLSLNPPNLDAAAGYLPELKNPLNERFWGTIVFSLMMREYPNNLQRLWTEICSGMTEKNPNQTNHLDPKMYRMIAAYLFEKQNLPVPDCPAWQK